MGSLFFSTIEVTRQAFYRTSLSYAIVNLKPIVPGHVLVIPTRPAARLADLDASELSSLMISVQKVGKVIERVYGADSLTIACQDGKAAGQSVPHVHFHLLPRKLQADRFQSHNDEVYPEIERSEASLPRDLQSAKEGAMTAESAPIKMDADEDRKPRTMEEMAKEAEWLKTFFEQT
ncbi:diadenosine 5',5'''-P1,P4-tetraphosphate asymmetrical hydrolase [Heliocybe sulcata]|uniref:Diadenosine 5',5'''-P1,P4-tetraphosphate asymmetrical hydrolase n=1 Tax=Heliocybe sulcata TaxID=5364 RepID=A0A5C3NHD8_9AGAM|nr:diadenosine 5',5'''-P1,P4-tetraphosphate asymmetrical hydrolase [Heliocybe sulcata]